MEGLLGKLIGVFPQYLTNLGILLIHPRVFVDERNGNTDENFNDALLFLAISVSLSVLFSWGNTQAKTDLWSALAAIAVTYLSAVALFAAVLRAIWWIVGGRAPFRSFFISYSYLASLVALQFSFAQLLARGFFRTFDTITYEAIRAGQIPTGLSHNTVYATANAISFCGALLAFLYTFFTWEVYERLNGIKGMRSNFAFGVTSLLAVPVGLIAQLVGNAMA